MLTKLNKLALLSLLMLTIVFAASAQAPRLTKGKLDFLKGQKKINVIYTYDNMKVGDLSEEAYIKKKVDEHNNAKPGKGDEWKTGWFNSRETRYKPKFEELINKQIQKSGAIVGDFPDAEYTMIVHTNFTEPGWHVGVMRRPASANFDINFVKTGTTDVKATLLINNVAGAAAAGFDYDAGSRIQESYAKAGKETGKYMVKNKVL